MAGKIKLTDRGVAGLTVEKGQRVEIADLACPGLVLRASATSKSWSVAYRPKGGKMQRLSLGSYPQVTLARARELALDALAKRAGGADPQAERKAKFEAAKIEAARPKFTVAMLADAYIEKYAKPRKKSWAADEYNLGRLKTALGDREASTVTKTDLRTFLDGIVGDASRNRTGDTFRNRVQATVRTMFKWAVEDEIVAANPIDGLKLRGGREKAKERVLKDDEIKSLFELVAGDGKPATGLGGALALVLLTAARPGEVIGMTNDELQLDGDAPEWRLPGSRTKSGKPRVVPLSAVAVAILRAQLAINEDRAGEPTPFLFPNRLDPNRPATKWALPQLVDGIRDKIGGEAFSAHDLRRTAATVAGQAGVNFETIQKLLGHSDGRVTSIYARYDFGKEMRSAVDRIAEHVAKARKIRENDKP